MKNRTIIICCGLLFISLFVLAQDEKISSRIGVNLGFGGFLGKVVELDRISSHIKGSGLGIASGGVKYEQFFSENQLGFAVGLQFSQYSATIQSDGKEKTVFVFFVIPVRIRDPIRWRYNYGEYLKIHSIKQTNYHLGIPLELRYFPKKTDAVFKFYYKFGATVNFLLSSTNSVEFGNNIMEIDAREVDKQIEKPGVVHTYFYPAFGMKFFRNHRVWLNMEIQIPGILIGKNAHPFIKPFVGLKLQQALQFPIKKQ